MLPLEQRLLVPLIVLLLTERQLVEQRLLVPPVPVQYVPLLLVPVFLLDVVLLTLPVFVPLILPDVVLPLLRQPRQLVERRVVQPRVALVVFAQLLVRRQSVPLLLQLIAMPQDAQPLPLRLGRQPLQPPVALLFLLLWDL